MASPSSPKDKFVVNVINPYLAEVKKHPQVVQMEDGVLHQEDLKGPIKEGSIQARHPPGCPGLRLRLHLGVKPSFYCTIFCYIFARIVPATYLAISCVFSSICFCQEIF